MKAKNELNGTDKAVSDNQTVVVSSCRRFRKQAQRHRSGFGNRAVGACYLLLAHGEYHFVGFQAVQSQKETSGEKQVVYVVDIPFYGGCGFFGVSSFTFVARRGCFH